MLFRSPSYYNQTLETFNNTITFSGTFPPVGTGSTNIFQITTGNNDHGFYTGDVVYYTPEKITSVSYSADGNPITSISTGSNIFNEGIYYIKRIDANNVQFAKSDSDIQNQSFVSTIVPVTVNNNKVELYKFKSKSLNSQKLLREISTPVNDGGSYSTPVGATGILINGVEVFNYKSEDLVYYGPINQIEIGRAHV